MTERDVSERLWLSERWLREVRTGQFPHPPALPKATVADGRVRYMFRDVDDYWGTPEHLAAWDADPYGYFEGPAH